MSRSVNIPIDFVANLSDAKQAWDTYRAYVAANPIAVGFGPTAPGDIGGVNPRPSAVATTFGGLTTTAPRPGTPSPSADPTNVATAAATAAATAVAREFTSRLQAAAPPVSHQVGGYYPAARSPLPSLASQLFETVGRQTGGGGGGYHRTVIGRDVSSVPLGLEHDQPPTVDRHVEDLEARMRVLRSTRDRVATASPAGIAAAESEARRLEVERDRYAPFISEVRHAAAGRQWRGRVPRLSIAGGGGTRPAGGPPDDPDVVEAEWTPEVPPGAIVRTSDRQRGPGETSPGDAGWQFYNPPGTRDYGDSAGAYGGSSDGPVGPFRSNGRFFQGARSGLNLRGGRGDPLQSLLQRGARSHLLPRYLPRAYEAAGGAAGLAGGYLAFEGYKSLATDYLAQNQYDNAETLNVSGDRGTHFQNQLGLYDAQRGFNPFSRIFNDPFGTQETGVRATFAQAGLADSNTAQFRSLRSETTRLRADALASSSDYNERYASIGVRAQGERDDRNQRFAGLREAAGQQAQYYNDLAEDRRRPTGNKFIDFFAGHGNDDATAAGFDRTATQTRDRLQGQLGRLQKAQQAAADAKTGQEQEQSQFDRSASLTEIRGETIATGLEFNDSRAAALQRIINPFDAAKTRAGRDIGLYGALDAQEQAALTASNLRYGRDTDNLAGRNRAGAISATGAMLSAQGFRLRRPADAGERPTGVRLPAVRRVNAGA